MIPIVMINQQIKIRLNVNMMLLIVYFLFCLMTSEKRCFTYGMSMKNKKLLKRNMQ